MPESGATDVFLSYSRRDAGFARWLHGALVERGKDVYVDWEDIPDWSPDYEAELESAICVAGTFVFVLSPDALASQNCAYELKVAVSNGKRIRPVLWRPVDGALVPPELSRPQWLDLSARAEPTVEKLVAALDVDPEWVAEHTRLLVRAREWESADRDASFLLRGNDLRAAEAWASRQAGKDPPSTPLQGELVLASRRSTTRRQRTVVGGVLVAFAVAVALAVVAFVQRTHAIHDAKVARSRELAALSLGSSTSNRQGLELALSAVDEQETPEAEDALRLALVRTNELARVDGDVSEYGAAFTSDGRGIHYICQNGAVRPLPLGATKRCPATDGPYTQSVFSSNGRYAAELGAQTVRFVEAATGKRLATIPVDHPEVEQQAITPDGTRALTEGDDRFLHLWALRKDGSRATQLGETGIVEMVSMSPDGRTFLTFGLGNPVRLRDSARGRLVFKRFAPRLPDGFILGNERTVIAIDAPGVDVWARGERRPLWFPHAVWAAVSRDARLLALESRDGRVTIGKLAQPGDTTASFRVASPGIVDFSPDGRLVTVAEKSRVGVWRTSSGESVGSIDVRPDTVSGVAVSPRGGSLLVQSGAAVSLRRITPAPLLATQPASEEKYGRVWGIGLDDARTATVLERGIVRVWAWNGGRAEEFRVGKPRPDADISSDGGRVAVAGPREIGIWNTRSRRKIATIRTEQPVGAPALSPDGTLVAALLADGSAHVWRTDRRDDPRVLSGVGVRGDLGYIVLEIGPGGDRIVARAGSLDGPRLFDIGTARNIPLRVPRESPTDVEFSPDGAMVAFAIGGRAFVVRASDGKLLRSIRVHSDRLTETDFLDGVAFGADGLLLTHRSDGTLRAWSIATGEERYALQVSSDPVVSSDGAVFAAADGKKLGVWSASSGKRLLTVPHGGSPVGFIRDDTSVVTLADHGYRLYGCEPCGSLDRLRGLARARLGRR